MAEGEAGAGIGGPADEGGDGGGWRVLEDGVGRWEKGFERGGREGHSCGCFERVKIEERGGRVRRLGVHTRVNERGAHIHV